VGASVCACVIVCQGHVSWTPSCERANVKSKCRNASLTKISDVFFIVVLRSRKLSKMPDDGDEQLEQRAELETLKLLDEKAVQLQKDGKYVEALTCMERGLVMRQHFFGSDSEEVWDACKSVGELCNFLAMSKLQAGESKLAEQLLKKAEILHQNDEPGQAVTFNNLACFYRKKGKTKAALQYLKKTLRIESTLETVENPGDTHLNMCAVLSELGRHKQALSHANQALIMLQDELFSPSDDGEQKEIPSDRLAVLAIAYHNIGAEHEHLNALPKAIATYEKGLKLAETHLGEEHGISETIRTSLKEAKNQLKNKGSRRGK